MPLQPRFSFSAKTTSIPLFLCLIIWNLSVISFPIASYHDSRVNLLSDSITDNETTSITLQTQDTEQSTITPVESETPIYTLTPTPTGTESSTLTATFQETAISTTSTTPIPVPRLTGDFATDEVLVRLDSSTRENGIEQCLESSDATIELQIDELDVLQVKVPTGKVAEAIASLSACPGVVYAEPNYVAQIADTIPLDPGWENQYGLLAIHAPQGWDLSTGSAAVTIAIVDTGVDLGHSDLAGKIVSGYDFVNNDNIPQDDNGHGTHVAGIAAANSNNNVGVAGVSWGAHIMPIKVLNAAGNGSFADVALGIIWATDNGAQVINLSLGGSMPSSVLEDAINYSYARGVTLVAATGNSGSNFVLYPARYPHVIAVGATDSLNNHATFSNFGPEIDVAAPGVAIYSTSIGNNYGFLSGTSMAVPFVSGLAAILRGLPTYTSPDQITGELETTALDLGILGRDDFYGFGLIQMDAAIQLAWPTPTPTFTPTFTSSFTPTETTTSTGPPQPNPSPSAEVLILRRSLFTATSTHSPASAIPSTTTTTVATQVSIQTTGEPTIAESTPISSSTPQSQRKPTNLVPFVPCLGIILIAAGVGLFWFAFYGMQGHRRKKLPGDRRLRYSKFD